MAGSSRPLQILRLSAGNGTRPWRFLFAIVLLMLPVAAAGQAVPVKAAGSADTRVVPGISVEKAPGPICVGQDHGVSVAITKVTEVLEGTAWKRYVAPPWSGVTLTASIKDPGIGTVSPAAMMTGWDLDTPGTVTFNFHPVKVGQTQIIFKGSASGARIEAKEPVRVVQCKYKVTVTSNMAANYPNLSVLALGAAEGEMKLDQSGKLNGSATVQWDVFAFSQCVSHDTQVSASPNAALKGNLSQDGSSLRVQADFQPISVSNTSAATCYASGGSSSTVPFTPPPFDISVPATGGGTAQPLSVTWGEVQMQGTAVISVIPVEDK